MIMTELVTEAEEYQITSAAWLEHIEEHSFTTELRTEIDNFIVEVTQTVSRTLSSGAEAEVHMEKSKLKGTKTIDTPTEAQHFLYEGGTLPSPKERRSCAFLRSWDAVGGKTKQNVLVYSEDKENVAPAAV